MLVQRIRSWFRRRDSKAGSATSVEIGSDASIDESAAIHEASDYARDQGVFVEKGRECLRCSNVASLLEGALHALQQRDERSAREMVLAVVRLLDPREPL